MDAGLATTNRAVLRKFYCRGQAVDLLDRKLERLLGHRLDGLAKLVELSRTPPLTLVFLRGQRAGPTRELAGWRPTAPVGAPRRGEGRGLRRPLSQTMAGLRR